MQRIVLQVVDSTMAAMERLLKYSQLPEGSVVSAEYQYLGKGMDDNAWESQSGCNMLSTFVLYPNFLHPSKQFLLNCCISLSVRDVVAEQLPDSVVRVKWPNDIYIGKHKVAGLLIRHEIQGEILERSIIGIGLNVNQLVFRSNAPNPASLVRVDGLFRNVRIMNEKLQCRLMKYYTILKEGGEEEMIVRYHNELYQIGVPAQYLVHEEAIEAIILGVDEFGQLQLRTASGDNISCDNKEIVFL